MRLRIEQLRHYLEHDIWQTPASGETSPRRWYIPFLRVLSLTVEGLFQNQLLMRAAGLSYASLIGLGPLVAIVVMVSGWGLNANPESRIKELLLFVAPTLKEYITVGAERAALDGLSELDLLIEQIVTGAESLLQQVNTGGKGTVSIIGILVLIFVGINLLTSIEKTFNAIWGVKRGRNWSQRIVSYWAFISLGALLGLGSTALFSASTLASYFNWLPFGETLTSVIITLSPFLAALMLVVMLTFGYQFFPNTTVRFRPALYGATLVAIVLVLNNFLSILYVQQVIRMKSVFGSMGILLVMMFGLYFFWMFILVGAQLTYAIQNMNFLTHREVWKRISVRTQEMVTLAAFLMIARRFHDCLPAPTSGELSEHLRVPGNVLNTSLGLLADNGWVTPIRETDNDGMEELHYRPSKPLARYSLAGFREAFANHGNSSGVTFVANVDPLLNRYLEDITQTPSGTCAETLDKLFCEAS